MKWHHVTYFSMLIIGAWILETKTPKFDSGRTPQSVTAESAMIDFASSAGH